MRQGMLIEIVISILWWFLLSSQVFGLWIVIRLLGFVKMLTYGLLPLHIAQSISQRMILSPAKR